MLGENGGRHVGEERGDQHIPSSDYQLGAGDNVTKVHCISYRRKPDWLEVGVEKVHRDNQLLKSAETNRRGH